MMECSECKWQKLRNDGSRKCHRFPPVVVIVKSDHIDDLGRVTHVEEVEKSVFPDADEYCGEFMARF